MEAGRQTRPEVVRAAVWMQKVGIRASPSAVATPLGGCRPAFRLHPPSRRLGCLSCCYRLAFFRALLFRTEEFYCNDILGEKNHAFGLLDLMRESALVVECPTLLQVELRLGGI